MGTSLLSLCIALTVKLCSMLGPGTINKINELQMLETNHVAECAAGSTETDRLGDRAAAANREKRTSSLKPNKDFVGVLS